MAGPGDWGRAGRQPPALPNRCTRLTSPRASRDGGGSSECSVGVGPIRARAGRGADGLRGHERARGGGSGRQLAAGGRRKRGGTPADPAVSVPARGSSHALYTRPKGTTHDARERGRHEGHLHCMRACAHAGVYTSRLNLPRERHVQAVWPRARGWGRRRRARTRGAARESAILVEKIERFVVSKDTVAAVRPSLCRCQKARTDRFLGLNEVAVGSCLTAGRPARNWAVSGGQRQ